MRSKFWNERNRKIALEVLNGKDIKTVAKDFNLSSGRIQEIVLQTIRRSLKSHPEQDRWMINLDEAKKDYKEILIQILSSTDYKQ